MLKYGVVCSLAALSAVWWRPAETLASPSKRRFDHTAVPPAADPSEGQERRTGPRREREPEPPHDPVVAILNKRGLACSGVLVHPRAVLTARHCQSGEHVVFGNDVAEGRLIARIVEFRLAPSPVIDMALAILDDAYPVSPYPLERNHDAPRSVRVVGFGCHPPDDCEASGRRSYFDVRLPMRGWGCESDEASLWGCLRTVEVLLFRDAGSDTCVGDSGGAVLAREDDHWVVVAITSRGIRDSVLRCGDGGIYVRVQPQLRWLEKELEEL